MMNGKIALDTSVVIRYLNGNPEIVNQVLQFSSVILPVTVVGELIFGAENSGKKLQNLTIFNLSMLVKFYQWEEKPQKFMLKIA